ncbi:N-acetyltransferase [Nocardioides sp. cx-169]|uniref:GNAT family N-acetyltransferase n=1 Tax=Nocardioides sp. cx-169 TaxID=2899080 RepID=UPI001E309157|nr:GNAT family N-acetyltransferase [Nocardioides sp. cx-169]MCD4533848.1 N-acetyltransferase [Nocardioides sp. cx-169]
MAATQVTDNAEHHRFEITYDGALAGFAEYELTDGGIDLTHTVVRDEFEGKGIGGNLVKHALDEARDRGLRVTPTCAFVKSYIERHPEYGDLVA